MAFSTAAPLATSQSSFLGSSLIPKPAALSPLVPRRLPSAVAEAQRTFEPAEAAAGLAGRRAFVAALVGALAVFGAAPENALAYAPKKKELVFKTLPSGLQIAEVQKGSGMVPKSGDMVVIHFTGKDSKGSTFASSRDSDVPAYASTPFGFQLGSGRVIKGWEEGVQGMKVGGRRKLIVPPELGFGSKGNATLHIPPNETLTYDIELLSVKRGSSSGARLGPLIEG